MEKKIATSPDELCRGFPEEFVVYIQYCRALQFEDKPDYNYIRSLLKNVFEKFSYEYDFQYDWNLIKKKKEEEEKQNDLNNQNTKEDSSVKVIVNSTSNFKKNSDE